MEVFIGSFVVFAISSLALGLGLLVWGRPIRGGCGQGEGNCKSTCRKRSCPNKAEHRITLPED